MDRGKCHIGQLVNWFGGYHPEQGLGAMLRVRDEDQIDVNKAYNIIGKRSAIRVEAPAANP